MWQGRERLLRRKGAECSLFPFVPTRSYSHFKRHLIPSSAVTIALQHQSKGISSKMMQLYCVIKSNSGSYYWGPLRVQILKMALQGSETPKCFKFGQQHSLPRKGKICKGGRKGKKIKIKSKSPLTISSYLLLWTVKKKREEKNQRQNTHNSQLRNKTNWSGRNETKKCDVFWIKQPSAPNFSTQEENMNDASWVSSTGAYHTGLIGESRNDLKIQVY